MYVGTWTERDSKGSEIDQNYKWCEVVGKDDRSYEARCMKRK